MTDPDLDRWFDHLFNHVSEEVRAMHLHRKVWLDSQAIVRDKPELPASYWWEYLGETYVVTQAVALRRQVDPRPDVISLRRTLVEMQRNPMLLTFEFFISRFGSDENRRSDGRARWEAEFVGDADGHVDPRIIEADLHELINGLSAARTLVNKHLAHRSITHNLRFPVRAHWP